MVEDYIDDIRRNTIKEIIEKVNKNPEFLHPINKERLEYMKRLKFSSGYEFTCWKREMRFNMNKKLALIILFGFPTVILLWIYHSLGINNYWQLFLFSFMAIIGYAPGISVVCMLETEWIRNRVKKDLGDFVDKR